MKITKISVDETHDDVNRNSYFLTLEDGSTEYGLDALAKIKYRKFKNLFCSRLYFEIYFDKDAKVYRSPDARKFFRPTKRF